PNNSDPVYSVAFSPDGKTLASAHQDGNMRLWDMATGRQIAVAFTGHPPAGVVGAYSVAFSPNGKTVAVSNRNVQLWDVATGHQGGPLAIHRVGVIHDVPLMVVFS